MSVEQETEQHVSNLKQGQSNILVSVRCRPLTPIEVKRNSTQIVQIIDQKIVILLDPNALQLSTKRKSVQPRSQEKHYAFDFAFPASATQEDIFLSTTQFLLKGVINGFNATVFAYGPTGAGKTFTMLGKSTQPGVMKLTIVDLFRIIEESQHQKEFQVRINYIEIYNEIIRDLINPQQEQLELREDPIKGVCIIGLTEEIATSSDSVIELIEHGNKSRTTEPTKANQTSSRSHAILQVTIEHKDKLTGVTADVFVGKLSLIDLAGSERASNTFNRGIRLIEGANINKSLLALGNCINALCEAGDKGGRAFIPYRDSKLTRILKDSLGGNCRTVMIACISPSLESFDETHNTLIYANRAKRIKTNIQRNVLNVQYHISRYTNIIENLQNEIRQLKSGSPQRALQDISQFEIQINQHFKQEALIRRQYHQLETEIGQLGFTIFGQQSDIQRFQAHVHDKIELFQLQKELQQKKRDLDAKEQKLAQCRENLSYLEKSREQLRASWAQLDEQQKMKLYALYQEKVNSIYNIKFQGQEQASQQVMRAKDAYIEFLQEQLKLRDQVIEDSKQILTKSSGSTEEKFSQAFNQLQIVEEFNSSSFSDLPGIKSNNTSPIRSVNSSIKLNAQSLPPIAKNSKIPRPKYTIQRKPIQREQRQSISPMPSQQRQPIRRFRQGQNRNRLISASSSNSEYSTNSSIYQLDDSSFISQKNSNIAERFNLSPYVQRGNQLRGRNFKRGKQANNIKRVEPKQGM